MSKYDFPTHNECQNRCSNVEKRKSKNEKRKAKNEHQTNFTLLECIFPCLQPYARSWIIRIVFLIQLEFKINKKTSAFILDVFGLGSRDTF